MNKELDVLFGTKATRTYYSISDLLKGRIGYQEIIDNTPAAKKLYRAATCLTENKRKILNMPKAKRRNEKQKKMARIYDLITSPLINLMFRLASVVAMFELVFIGIPAYK